MNTRLLQEKLEEARLKFREEGVKAFISMVNVDIRARAAETINEVQGPLAAQQAMKNQIERETRAKWLERMSAAGAPLLFEAEKIPSVGRMGFFGNLFRRQKVSEKRAEQEGVKPLNKK
jgi:hypothetical protein